MEVQRNGSYAEYITMPIERIYDGKGLDPKILAMMSLFQIGFHGVNRGEVRARVKKFWLLEWTYREFLQ